MGQYYKPTVLKQSWRRNDKPIAAALYCYDYKDEDGFGYGAKLMEHSYVLNDMVIDAVALLGTKYKGYPFVWVGDYADEQKVNGKEVSIYHEAGKFVYKDYDGDDDGYSTAYLRMKREIKWYRHDFKYLVNYDKKEFCVIPEAKEEEYVPVISAIATMSSVP